MDKTPVLLFLREIHKLLFHTSTYLYYIDNGSHYQYNIWFLRNIFKEDPNTNDIFLLIFNGCAINKFPELFN